jgi:lipid-binding SYLF domain-containing protein
MYSRIFSLAVGAFACLAGTFASAATESRQDSRLNSSTQILSELQASPDQNVPHWLLERAYAVVIVPSVIKVGLGIGARRGSGVLVVRKDDGHWTNPVFVNLTGGSFGFQIGVQSTDVLLVFTSRASVEGIVGGKITLGADASVAAGPVGRQTAAATDIGLAQVYSYSRARGLFAGVALDGSALTVDSKSNAAYYNRPGVLGSEIIAGNAPQPPETAREFIGALDKILGVTAVSAVAKPASAPAGATPNPTPTPASGAPAPGSLDPIPGKLTTHPMEDPNPGTEPPQ